MSISQLTRAIEQFFASHDYDHARKRTLDLIYDSQNKDYMKQGLQWSRQFYDEDYNHNPGKEWVSQGLELLKKLEKHTYHEQPIKLLAKAEGISKAYRAGKFALKNIDFTINSGEIVGILWAKMAMVKRLFCVI